LALRQTFPADGTCTEGGILNGEGGEQAISTTSLNCNNVSFNLCEEQEEADVCLSSAEFASLREVLIDCKKYDSIVNNDQSTPSILSLWEVNNRPLSPLPDKHSSRGQTKYCLLNKLQGSPAQKCCSSTIPNSKATHPKNQPYCCRRGSGTSQRPLNHRASPDPSNDVLYMREEK
jgi:hypothetical protein